MIKATRIPLISKTERDGKQIPYKDICKILWELQNETRTIKNKAVQLCWEWLGYSSDYKAQNGDYPKEKEHLLSVDKKTGEVKGYALQSFLYDELKGNYMQSGNYSQTIQLVYKAFKKNQGSILKGDKSIVNYKWNQPLDLHCNSIKLDYDKEENQFTVQISLLNKAGKQKFDIQKPFIFESSLKSKQKGQRVILERCIDGIYKIGGSKLIYDQKKRQWVLLLSYSFESEINPDPQDNILGVQIGVFNSVVASVLGDYDSFKTEGGEVEVFRAQVEKRKKQMSKQRKNCGDGSIGHGYHTRTGPVLNIKDKIARFRDTYNHKISRAVVNYAVRKKCGIIQMESLKGYSQGENGIDGYTKGFIKEKDPFLKNWSYYDLQQKIETKAKEKGIEVYYLNPELLSLRCSACGHIDKANLSETEKGSFKCTKCGYEANSDYNESQNISIKDIDKDEAIVQKVKEIKEEQKKAKAAERAAKKKAQEEKAKAKKEKKKSNT